MAKIILTERAAQPLGHYSQAIVHNGIIYLATQLGIIPGKSMIVGTIEEQTQAALNNVREILLAAGSDLDRVLKITIYLSDMSLWDRVNVVYTQFFKNYKPARGIIPCGLLHKGFQVAIDAIAAVDNAT